jgi:ketosteroid isomerase-like protein
MRTTQSAFEHHLQCFGTGDLDGILSDYSDDAALLTHVGALRGQEASRSFFEATFAELGKPGTSFDVRATSRADARSSCGTPRRRTTGTTWPVTRS